MKESIQEDSLIKVKAGSRISISAPVKDVPFYKIGNGNRNSVGESMNLIQEMTNMTKPELFMISEMERRLSYINEYSVGEVILDMRNYTSTEKQYIKKAYKLLFEKKIICRTRRSHYMFNPLIMLPRNKKEAVELWYEHSGEHDKAIERYLNSVEIK